MQLLVYLFGPSSHVRATLGQNAVTFFCLFGPSCQVRNNCVQNAVTCLSVWTQLKWWAAGAPNVVTFCCLSVSNFLGAEHSLLWFCLTWFAILCGLNSIQWFVCLLWPRFQVWNRCGLKQWLLCLVGPSCQMRNSCGTKCNYLFVYLDAAVRWSAGEHPTVTCFSIWAQIK